MPPPAMDPLEAGPRPAPDVAARVVDAAPYGVLAFDRECRYTVWNPAMERIAGLPAERVLGRVAWEVFPFLLEVGDDAHFRTALAGEEAISEQAFHIPETGRMGFYEGRYVPLRDAAGSVVGGMALIRDVTQSRRAGEALQMQGLVLESMSEGVSVSDEAGFILYTNPAEDRMFGYAPGELVGQRVTVQNAYPPEENERIVAEVIASLREQGVWTGEWRNRRKDGTLFSTFARITALEMSGHRYWVCVQEDVTERLRAEDRSRRLQALAAELNESIAPAQVAAVCAEHGMSALEADAASFWVLADDGATLELAHSVGLPSELVERFPRLPVVPGRPLSDALLGGVPVMATTSAGWETLDPDALPALARMGAAGMVAVPVAVAGKCLGGLALIFHGERGFAEEDRTFLALLGQQAAQALERARLYEAEHLARDAAEQANRAKTEFLSAMSHELRTPLNAIAGYLDLLDLGLRGPLTDAQRADLDRIKRAQQLLLSLINDVLNFARLEAGRIEYRREPVALEPLLEGLRAIIEPQVGAQGLGYRCDAGEAGLSLLGDGERVQQILLNLLSNAVKFTDRGGSIDVRASAEGEWVRVRVTDTGRGIPPERLASIFDPFVQVERHRTEASQQGVGLGLAISRELAHGMGGDLVAESEPGRGSAFTLTLPRG